MWNIVYNAVCQDLNAVSLIDRLIFSIETIGFEKQFQTIINKIQHNVNSNDWCCVRIDSRCQ